MRLHGELIEKRQQSHAFPRHGKKRSEMSQTVLKFAKYQCASQRSLCQMYIKNGLIYHFD